MDYYKAFVQADRDKYYWHGQEWVSRKRAMVAENKLADLRKTINKLLSFATGA